MLILFFGSCTGNNSGKENAENSSLRYGLTTEPVTLDPVNPANTADGRSILFNVFEGLVKPSPEGKLLPAVAESFNIEQNSLVYIFTIREGVVFHNGEILKPTDVVFSLNTAIQNGFPGFGNIDRIEKSGERDIRIHLKEADPDFLPYLTVGIVPENNPDREKNPIGTGPFIIESYTPQRSLVLKKNPDYWHNGLPLLDEVTLIFVSDSDALLTGLRGGNIEGAAVTGAQLSQLSPDEFDIIPWYSNTVQLLALNNAVKPLDNPIVRKAINYALNISGIIDTAFFGKGEPSGSPLIPGLRDIYEESLRNPYPFDTEKAKTLLAEAGFADGFPLEIIVPSNYTMHVDTAQVIVNQLKDAGINCTIKLVDWGTWFSEVYRGRIYQATIISLDANNVSPRSFLSRYVSGDSGNFINFNSPEYNLVYKAALVENDEIKRIALYRDCQKIISDNAASVFIQDILGFRAFSGGRFGGVANYPLYIIDFAPIYKKSH